MRQVSDIAPGLDHGNSLGVAKRNDGVYRPSPPQWLLAAQRKQTNAWHQVLADLGMPSPEDTDDDSL